jgi:transposase-like protein
MKKTLRPARRPAIPLTTAIRSESRGGGNLDIEVPRDRDASFEPITLPKGQSPFAGFDDKIIGL